MPDAIPTEQAVTQFELIVKPRPGARDPQADAVSCALRDSDFATVRAVSVGRYLLISVDDGDSAAALAMAHRVCQSMLVNPHIETYELRPIIPPIRSTAPLQKGM